MLPYRALNFEVSSASACKRTILKLQSPDSPDNAVATRAWSNLIGALIFQRKSQEKPPVSPDPSSSSEGAGHETMNMATDQLPFPHLG